jgi:ATP-dependent Clp protease ATP-binding subunit ClpB
MALEVSEDARRFIARQGYDPVYGARPLRRYIAREVETKLGRAMLAGTILDGSVIRLDMAEGELTISFGDPPGEHR